MNYSDLIRLLTSPLTRDTSLKLVKAIVLQCAIIVLVEKYSKTVIKQQNYSQTQKILFKRALYVLYAATFVCAWKFPLNSLSNTLFFTTVNLIKAYGKNKLKKGRRFFPKKITPENLPLNEEALIKKIHEFVASASREQAKVPKVSSREYSLNLFEPLSKLAEKAKYMLTHNIALKERVLSYMKSYARAEQVEVLSARPIEKVAVQAVQKVKVLGNTLVKIKSKVPATEYANLQEDYKLLYHAIAGPEGVFKKLSDPTSIPQSTKDKLIYEVYFLLDKVTKNVHTYINITNPGPPKP